MTELDKQSKILVTGAGGMLGRALCAQLVEAGHEMILAPTRAELDLLNAAAVTRYFMEHQPRYVFHLAAMVFGLGGNLRFNFQSLSSNTLLNHNVLTACALVPPIKIFFAGTVASYPFPYRQLPLAEEDLTGASPHVSEYGYARAKMHALSYLEVMQRDIGVPFTYGILTNLYGPHDRFDIENGHVIPSLICKVHRAVATGAPFQVWGDGSATRDFLHVDDAARAALLATARWDGVVNLCSGECSSIRKVVSELRHISGWQGEPDWLTDMPTGIPERSVSASRLRGLGFKAHHTLVTGLAHSYEWYAANQDLVRKA